MEPITLTLPWAVLVRDNAKYGVCKGRMILTRAYRTAKEKAHLLAMGEVKWRRLSGRVAIYAVLYEPDRDRDRDVSNYCKLVHDALSGAGYEDDAQLDDVHWVRGPVDPNNPRVEITLTPVAPTPYPPRKGQDPTR